MLEYSLDEKNIAGKLKKSTSDIVIYTEDNDECHLFYKTLFDRIGLDMGLKIVTQQLGSCDDVQQSCDEDEDDSYAKLYLVDGDLFLMYEPKKEKKNFFPLDRYCIENFLLDQNAIVELAYANNGTKGKEILKDELCYEEIMSCIAQKMLPIYCRNAVLKCVKDRNKFKGWGYFYDNKNKCFFQEKIEIEKEELEKEITNEVKNSEIAIHMIHVMEEEHPHNVENALRYLSGKDCLLSYLQSQICFKTQTNIGMDRAAIKLLLAKECDLNSFSALRNKIRQVIEKFNQNVA